MAVSARASAKIAASDEWRAKHTISVFGVPPNPILTFDSAKLDCLPPSVRASFKTQGFAAPTPIQSQAWPVLLAGDDFIGIAKTGSGKTLAFMVPTINRIATNGIEPRPEGPTCVVLAPTRELAQQIDQETQKVLPTGMRSTVVYGGTSKEPQIAALKRGVHILVGTPGRLMDLLQMGVLSLKNVQIFVLDEADRMLDLGFEPDVRTIIGQMPKNVPRQTVMFSATWPETVQALAAQFQRRDTLRIHVGNTELHANNDVTQRFIFVKHAGMKMRELCKLLDKYRGKRVLVFVLYKKTASIVEQQLAAQYPNVVGVNSDKTQQHREAMLDRFRTQSDCILVATDVAARGLDVKQLDVVINYEFVLQVDDYVHRIGRTGRAGAKGEAYTILADREDYFDGFAARELCQILEGVKQPVPPELIAVADTVKNRFKPTKAKKDKVPENVPLTAAAGTTMKFADSDDDEAAPVDKKRRFED